MRSIFKIYLFDVIYIDVFLYKFGQSLENLSYDKSKTDMFFRIESSRYSVKDPYARESSQYSVKDPYVEDCFPPI
jgi:hypothetical protein